MDSIVGPVLGCSILVIVLRVLWLVFYDSYFFFEPWFWLMMWINWLLLLGSDYCVIRKFNDGGSYLYRWCYDDLWWATWVVVAVWAEGAFVDLIWMGCIHLETGCGGVVYFFRWRARDIFLLYSFFSFQSNYFWLELYHWESDNIKGLNYDIVPSILCDKLWCGYMDFCLLRPIYGGLPKKI